MSEQEQTTPAAEQQQEEATATPPAAGEDDSSKKSVSFEQKSSGGGGGDLTFDEAQAEIDAIKARAGEARASLRTGAPPASTTSAYSSYSSSSYGSGGGALSSAADSDAYPKSNNMLSHLNSHSAMLNYKVQAARSLVRKQEDLLRNLARMRENMERSECELFKACDVYVGGGGRAYNHRPAYGYFERRAESAPYISRRAAAASQREASPAGSEELRQISGLSSDAAATVCPVDTTAATSTHISSTVRSSLPHHTVVSSASAYDYQPDADFEKEMAALRKRVSDLSKKATEAPVAPRYTSRYYDYELPRDDLGYLSGGGAAAVSSTSAADLYSVPAVDTKFEQSMTEGEVQ